MRQVLIDFSNLAYTCYFPALAAQQAGERAVAEHLVGCPTCQANVAGPVKTPCPTAEQIPVYDAQQVLRTNLKLKLETLTEAVGVEPNHWTFIKDGHDASKYALYPGYKGNRDPDRFDPRPLAEKYLRGDLLQPDAKWLWSPDHEADDTIASLAATLASMGAEVVVVSSDKDLWSLLSHPNVSVFSTSQKVWVEPEQIEKAFGLKDPKFITLHKSLWGDTSDSIPNAVPRMQKALIPVIETTDGTLKSFWMKAQEATLSPRCLELLWGNAAQVDKNYALVKLCEDSVVPVEA